MSLNFGANPNPFEAITGAKTIKAYDHGKTFGLAAATGAAITLPPPMAGMKLKFITTVAFGTTAWTIVATGAIIQGSVIVNAAKVALAGVTTLTLAHAADTLGDHLELESDGTNWYVSGVAALATGISGS